MKDDSNTNPVTGNPYTYAELQTQNCRLRERLHEQTQQTMETASKIRGEVVARIQHLLPAGINLDGHPVEQLVATAVMGLRSQIYRLERELEAAKQQAAALPGEAGSSPTKADGSKAATKLRRYLPRVSLCRLYRNWPVHNLVAHPVSEVAHWLTGWLCGHAVSGWIHDVTIPPHEKGTGRG